MGGAQLFAAPTETGTEFKLENKRPTPVLLERDMLRLHTSSDTSPRRATKKQFWTGCQPALPSIIPTSVSSQGSRPDRLAASSLGSRFRSAPFRKSRLQIPHLLRPPLKSPSGTLRTD